MNANELADAMEIRASIRRQATSRKSVQENANDRLADQLDEAAIMLRQQQAEIEALKKEAALQRLSDFTQEAESFDRTASHMAGEYVSYPVKELTDAITLLEKYADKLEDERPNKGLSDVVLGCVEILRKAQE
jgi:hypothetical protein